MSNCRFCSWMRKRVCVDCTEFLADQRKQSRAWERAVSVAAEPEQALSEQQKDRIFEVDNLFFADPAAAFVACHELADQGSIWAMETLGWCLEGGFGCEVNLAEAGNWYRLAGEAGSLISTLDYARVLERQGRRSTARQVLRAAAEAGYLPANYWLAQAVSVDRQDKEGVRQIVALLEPVAAAGHLEARAMLVRLLIRGRLGLRGMVRGWRLAIPEIRDFVEVRAADRAADKKANGSGAGNKQNPIPASPAELPG